MSRPQSQQHRATPKAAAGTAKKRASRGDAPGRAGNGRPLVIVESPAKARTVARFLGSAYRVEASIGHVRDLPEKAAEIPPSLKKEKWARLGVNVEKDFEPLYVIPSGKKKHVEGLRRLARQASELLLATDEDREGESISWHLREVLDPKVPARRLVFHEITKEAIQGALASPRGIDEHLVRAQETRRILDRLFGYEVSPLLWKKVRPRLSAGRVQSCAIRLVVDRERERMRFRSSQWWDILGRFTTRDEESLEAVLQSVGGRKIATGRSFDPLTGRSSDPSVLVLDERQARALADRIQKVDAQVKERGTEEFSERPPAPFTTSTLQQEANRKLRWTARRTMDLAQRLYEHGFITYMRTDSTTLSDQALEAARALILERYGREYLPGEPRRYQTRVRNAQEAHEAIRPAGSRFAMPDEVARALGADAERLYDLIWKRTVACQMADARGVRVVLSVEAGEALFEARGRTIHFPGFLRAYVEGSDDPEAELAGKETILPEVRPGDRLSVAAMDPRGHTTQPPPRLTEASLIRELERRGIGRPSTYASIIDTILERDYVFKKGTALVPTFTAFAVVQLLQQHLPELVDFDFTATMEEDLDRISLGETGSLGYLRKFYFGNGRKGLKPLLKEVEERIDPRNACTIALPAFSSDGGGDRAPVVRVGRYGPFLEKGGLRASLPQDLPPDELTPEKVEELLAKEAEGPRELGKHPESSLPVLVRSGRFGPYLQLGEASGKGKKPPMASVPPGVDPEKITLDQALAVLALPKELGRHPEGGEPVLLALGRFGYYIRCGKETRTLPVEGPVPEVALDEALALLAKPKERRFARGPKVLRELGKNEEGEAVRLMSGRYGPYVTDGKVNASLPRGENPEEVSLERARELLRQKVERGPSPPKRRRRGAASRSN